jgi:hypothetical protein
MRRVEQQATHGVHVATTELWECMYYINICIGCKQTLRPQAGHHLWLPLVNCIVAVTKPEEGMKILQESSKAFHKACHCKAAASYAAVKMGLHVSMATYVISVTCYITYLEGLAASLGAPYAKDERHLG